MAISTLNRFGGGDLSELRQCPLNVKWPVAATLREARINCGGQVVFKLIAADQEGGTDQPLRHPGRQLRVLRV